MIIDSIIGAFSPKAKYNRQRYRALCDAMDNATKLLSERKYEGASKGRRTDGWHTSSTSANSEIKGSLVILRNRSRDLVRNNPYARRGIRVIGANVVGKGIRANILGPSKLASDRYNLAWQDWALTPACDFDGKNTLYGLQRLVIESIATDGEILIRKRIVPGAKYPMKLQVLECDFLNSSLNTKEGNNFIRQGIEFDPEDNIVAYHLFEKHPGNTDSFITSISNTFKTVRVPANEIIHVFMTERAGQIRGVPWLAPVVIKLKDADDYEDAQLLRQKIAACFAIFIQDSLTPDEPTTDAQKIALGEKVEPGIIEILPQGKTMTFANPPTVQNYPEYISSIMHSIAIGLGISYEALTGDLSQVNFSSGRMGWIEMQRNIDTWRDTLLNPMFNEAVFEWFLELSSLVGLNPKGVYCQWIAPRREMIDPTKETAAKISAIRAGIESLEDVVFQNGKEPLEHFAQIQKTNQLLDDYELTLDSDPRKIDNSGKLQGQVGGGQSADQGNGNADQVNGTALNA